ncbi:MAG: hypothetical protein Q7V58_08670 [Actinomycetota bacterium]|nr:hypothetical protein [Actinomycetota bacterium]
MRRRKALLAALAIPVAATLIGVGAVSAALAETSTLDGLQATGRVEASRYSFWYGQVNRDGICALISGCTSATGADGNWVFQVAIDTPAGVQTMPVTVATVEQTVFASARYRLAFTSVVGNLNGDVVLALKQVGKSTDVSVRLEKVVASGFATDAIPQFQQHLQPYLTSRLGILSRERIEAGTDVTMKVRPGARAVATVTVTGASLSARKPVATGVLRLLVNDKPVCIARVSKSKATCRFAAPAKGARIQAVVTGSFNNGYEIWNSAAGKYRP